MAIAAVSEAETRLCGNCKKDVPVANFIMHEIHCSRNIEVCRYCSDLIPKSEMKNHIESEHVQVTCKCGMKIEKRLFEDHEASACPLRPAVCQYCDIQLTFNNLQDHEIYCGARTERCGGCGRNVMLKDLKEHPRACGREVTRVRGSRAVPRFEDEDADLHALGDIRNRLRSEDELEQLERNEDAHSSLYEEWNADLDYVLALSLQNENNPHDNSAAEIPSDFWENYYAKESVPSARLKETDKSNIFSCDSLVSFSTSSHVKNDEIIMLPCEFCEELYPADDLILHQTGCNPASAFASFSKRSSPPNPREHDGLRAVRSRSCRSLSSSQPRAVQAERNVMIPCEFCGIQLEEETLFHHQHHCDLRPASPAAGFPSRQPLSPRGNGERRESPELARRRIRHQGDVSPRCTEGFGQQRPSYPARGTKSLNNVANTRNAPLSSSARARDAPDSRGKPRKVAGAEGRPKNRGASESAGGTTPRARPTQNFHSEAFTSSFSRTSPAQPSTSNGGARSLGAADGPLGFRRRNTKAKAQRPAPGHPEEK
ncbi:TRAF-type zinc finger domain-containing protein 1 isoform X1 [Egretta garzetta]|uniref:TRAF-type zinc finger domain-containing protein 1 isoform X1 n=1 Tax=Egretta garzetta TaxID=188379 RepID=UPI00163C13CC|nr:TRAF-type zinc finger domain-containing protein 1 isoform X1 [Egretta garzetta]